MTRFHKKTWATLILAFFAGTVSLYAQYVVADLSHLELDKVYVKGFSVKNTVTVKLDAVGVMSRSEKWNRSNPMIAYGWILNADTKEVMWAMQPDNVNKDWGSRNVSYQGQLALKPGNYEAYFSTYGQKIIRISSSDSYMGEFFKNLVKVFVEDTDLYEDAEAWNLRITCSDGDRDRIGSFDGSKPKNAFVALTGARDSDYLEKGFTLEKELKIKIYCVGEGQDRRMYDYGWISDDKSARFVWEMRFENTSPAGGAQKNRMYSGTATLPAGNYVATYVTDDSHSFTEWNMQPPYDPSYWGLTLSVLDERDLAYIREYKKVKREEIVAITGVGDGEYRSEGISLKRDTDLHIYALGEGVDHRMYDYGWITNAETGQTVWEMRYDETKFAGGSEKNRLFDGVITLTAGNYKVNYRTDNSHSYHDWNADPPFNRNKWGITLSLVNDADKNNFGRYRESTDASILTQIVRVGDDEYRVANFNLEKGGKIRITCLGEGKNGRMYDYAWIKNAKTGQTVWEMTYGMTENAGGARKNRLFNGVIYLDAGDYQVVYISDGSHSFEDWNDDPPNNPENWGVTIRQIK